MRGRGKLVRVQPTASIYLLTAGPLSLTDEWSEVPAYYLFTPWVSLCPWGFLFMQIAQKPARSRMPGEKFPLYHSPANLSISKMNKIIAQENPIIVQHYQLTFGAVCGILMMSRGETTLPRVLLLGEQEQTAKTWAREEISKKNKKPLDKPPKL